MPTTYLRVPVGTSAPFEINPAVSVVAGASVLGGGVLVETAPTSSGPWRPWTYGTITQTGCVRPSGNGWARVTASTSPANVFLVDVSGANLQTTDQLAVITAPLATASATTEQVVFCLRIPPLFLPRNFGMKINLGVSLTNNANVKTLRVRWGGVGGTALFTSPSLASQLNYNALSVIVGRGDGSSVLGLSVGASGGIGVSTTAYPTVTADYINQETELVVTAQKATGTDTMQLETCLIQLF